MCFITNKRSFDGLKTLIKAGAMYTTSDLSYHVFGHFEHVRHFTSIVFVIFQHIINAEAKHSQQCK